MSKPQKLKDVAKKKISMDNPSRHSMISIVREIYLFILFFSILKIFD